MKINSLIVLFLLQIGIYSEALATRDLPYLLNEEQKLEHDFESIDDNLGLSRLDQLAIEKMDFVAALLLKAISSKIAEFRLLNDQEVSTEKRPLLSVHFGSLRADSIFEDQKHLRSLYESYLREKQRFGKSKDHLRTAAYRKFLKYGFELYRKLGGRKDQQGSYEPSHSAIAKELWRHIPSLFPLIYSRDQRRSHAGFSRILRVGSALSSVYFSNGMEWSGESELNSLALDESLSTVNLIVMNHSEPLYDKFILARLLDGLSGPSAIVALAQGWQKSWVANLAMKNQSIISVGERDGIKYGDTSARILATLDGGIRNLFLFPEGSTGAGFGELKPIAEGFVNRLLPSLLRKYKVRLLVVTTVDTYRLLGSLNLNRPVRIVVGPLIQDIELRAKVSANPQDFENELRKIWALNLENSSKKLYGQFRITELLRFLEENLGIIPSLPNCKDHFSGFNF